MKKDYGFIILLISILMLFTASSLSAKTRGIQVSVKTSEGRTIDLYRDSYALVIGNGNYRKGWDPLPGAVRDVKEVAQALKRQGFKVTLKTDLTKGGFNRVFSDFVYKHGSGMDNRLLFYYAGHGYTRQMATDEQLGYLVMVDAPGPEDFGGFNLHSVDMVSMVTQAKMIKAKHALFIFDSCFSGTVLNLRDRIVPAAISDNIRQPVRQFITAGRANESVPDYSVFKQCFLDILEGRDEEPIHDGYLTGEELGLYLKNKVPTYNKNQHPQYGKIRDPKLDKGDFVFLLSSVTKKDPIRTRVQAKPVVLPKGGETSFDDILRIEQEQRQAKKKWKDWQGARDTQYRKVKDIDKSENLTPKQKSVAWKRFLAAVAQDNPYSQQDDKMRSFSISRLSHWENVKPVKIQKPVPVDDFTTQGSKVTARDGILVAYASGVVYDKNTGLEWYAGPDEDINWYEAKSWVQSLNIAGGGWRMPTRKEIESLHKKAVRTRNVTSLLKITEYFVWSGEIKGPSEYARAGVFYFRYGGQDAWLTCSGSDEMRVFAVRSRR